MGKGAIIFLRGSEGKTKELKRCKETSNNHLTETIEI
jgi:hypothetical protein